ncbi:WG repeat-containing protein [Bradyrhizobium uaiense]|uniref:WG repeat-containing protein n=1 Tax=Bradyrhizobium uaiense TaxID=2594946 RepID=A0A6P1BQ61_9BRAD|nr:WG repeat-containing protein [Bradyrhizobium uaiense]
MIATTQAIFGQSPARLPGTIGSEAQADALENLARKKDDVLIPTCRFAGGRCGYIDRSGNTVIAPEFDWADRFGAGRALVRRAGKYGAIDTTGRLAIAPVYDAMSSVDRGLALVLVGDRLGVIDENGHSIVPAEHGAIIRISPDAFLVAEPPYVVRRRPLNWKDVGPGKRWGVVAAGGNWIVRPTFAQVSALSDELSGLFWAAGSAHMDARWTLMDSRGVAVNNELFDHVQQIQPREDRAIVKRGNRWGAIDGKGNIVVALKFDWLGYFRDGWAPYRLAGSEGRINRDGGILSEAAASEPAARPSAFSAKVSAVVGGKALYTDQAGTQLLGSDHPRCPDGRHLGFAQGRWTIMTADNRPLPDIEFEYVHLACNSPSIVRHDGKWGFISTEGNLVANRYFDRADPFHGGIAAVVDAGLWAVIGEDGAFLLGPLKLARGTFISGTGEYGIEFEEGYRTLDRAQVAELARNPEPLTHRLAPRLPWSEGLAAKLDGNTDKWGFIDSTGEFVIAPQFDAVDSFRNGVAWAAFPDRREWCQIDKAGRIEPNARCRCGQPLVIVEHYYPPPNVACYDDGLRIVRGFPGIRGMAN